MTLITKIIKQTILNLLFVGGYSLFTSQLVHAAPPFSGTIFIDPDIVIQSDPSTFQNATYTGQAVRNVFDRRTNAFGNINMHLVTANYSDGASIEIQVNPELGGSSAALAQANYYGPVIGQIPAFLRKNVKTATIHNGNMPFGGGNKNLLIHIGKTVDYVSRGILPETLIHEAGHASLDPFYTHDTVWNAAQAADGNFISTYGRDNPYREDLAESILPWIAVNYRADRISQALKNTITQTIPNRLAFFTNKNFNVSPLKTPASGGSVPLVPTGLSSNSITQNSYSAHWAAVAGATSYKIRRWSNSGAYWFDAGTTTTTSKSFFNLNETAQNFIVQAINGSGSSAFSAYHRLNLLPTITIPPTPTGSSSSNITHNSFTAKWTAVKGADSYKIKRWSNAGAYWFLAGTSTTNSLNFFNLNEKAQNFRVQAVNSAGGSSFSTNHRLNLTPNPITPVVPAGLSITNVSHNAFTINWEQVGGATSYAIQRYSFSGKYWFNAGATSATSISFSHLNEKAQFVKVKAINSAGNSGYSDYVHQTLHSDPVKPAKATGLRTSHVTGNSFTALWTGVAGALSYEIQRFSYSGKYWFAAGTSTSPSISFSHLGEKEQFFRVKAINSVGDSGYSDYTHILLP